MKEGTNSYTKTIKKKISPVTLTSGQRRNAHPKNSNVFLKNCKKEILPCKSVIREVSFEWQVHRISSTRLKVKKKVNRVFLGKGEPVNIRALF